MKHERIDQGEAIRVAWREPFSLAAPYVGRHRNGATIAEIVASVPDLPARFAERGIVCINGHEINRELWGKVKPKPYTQERPIAVTLHWRLAGGGNGNSGAKSIIALVGAIALTAITGGIASGTILGNFTGMVGTSLFGSATLGAQVLAGAVGIAGALAISALTAPPVAGSASNPTATQKEAASATGNTIAPGGAIPRVLGTRRLFPPLATDPIIEIVDDDQYVEALFVLNGPHALTDIRIGDASLNTAEDVEVELREGWPDDTPVTLTARQGKQAALNIEMSSHTVDATNQANLKDAATPANDLPVFHPFASRKAPDEVWLHATLPAGLCKQSDPTDDRSIPFRVRFRQRGSSTWINCPEVHLSERTSSAVRVAFKFMWQAGPGVIPAIPAQSGFVYASINVPAQNVAPTGGGWTADSYFSDGTGSDYLQAGAEASSKVANTLLYDNRVEFYLDPATFPQDGVYEFEIKRGCAYDPGDFTGSTYTYSGSIYDFFGYFNASTPQIPLSRADLSDTVTLDLLQSIWNEHPIAKSGFALIAVRALNRRMDSLSVLASGYVKDWDGTAWNTWTTTSNPAPHYADVLSGSLNRVPLPVDLRDDAGLVAWRAKCTANDWTADILVEDMRTDDLLTLLASCGFARPYQSEVYGVVVDDDRSADDLVQVFTPRNSSGFRWQKAFARVPDGFVITYPDANDDYNDAQTIVYRRGYSGGDDGNFESVTYDGLPYQDKAALRGQFDLDQADLRSAFYYLDTDMEAIVCRKGDLVAVQHDVIDQQAGFALLKEKILDSGNITGFVLDSEIPVVNEADMHDMTDMHAVDDMHLVGFKSGILLRHDDGTNSAHALADATGDLDTITLVTPIPDDATIVGFADTDWKRACMLASGRLASEYRRLLVSAVAPGKDGAASLTLVDEAPDLVRTLLDALLLSGDEQITGFDDLLLSGDQQESGTDALELS